MKNIMEAHQIRMINEYYDLCNKYKKLIKLLRDYDIGQLKFTLNCPVELLKEQADVMKRYIDILFKRSEYENIKLDKYDFNIEYGEEYGRY